jgi:hypothetical protein
MDALAFGAERKHPLLLTLRPCLSCCILLRYSVFSTHYAREVYIRSLSHLI